jgi:polyphenol oxidase
MMKTTPKETPAPTPQLPSAPMPAALEAHTLARLAGIRHAFFTRAGGVSTGVYASLNAGIGSNDAPENVATNRARMAGALGVTAERFLTA